MAADGRSYNSSNGFETETERTAVYRLVAESVQEARAREGNEGVGSAPCQQTVPTEKSVLRQAYEPAQSASRMVVSATVRSTIRTVRTVAYGGMLSVRAARSLGSLGRRGLSTMTDRDQIEALLAEAEDNGRWLVEGLAGLAGYGRTNP